MAGILRPDQPLWLVYFGRTRPRPGGKADPEGGLQGAVPADDYCHESIPRSDTSAP